MANRIVFSHCRHRMPPTHYMRFIEEDGVWVSRIFFTSNAKQTLGSNFLQGKSVLFDMDHERMGFAESSCSLDRAVSKDSDQNSRHAMKSFRESMTEEMHAMSSLLRQEASSEVVRRCVTAGIIIAIAATLLCLHLRKRRRRLATEDIMTNGESQPLLTLSEGANGSRYHR